MYISGYLSYFLSKDCLVFDKVRIATSSSWQNLGRKGLNLFESLEL